MDKNNKSGAMGGGEKRKEPEDTTGARLSDGEVLMTDGPFVDSKEQIDRVARDDGDATESPEETAAADETTIDVRLLREPS